MSHTGPIRVWVDKTEMNVRKHLELERIYGKDSEAPIASERPNCTGIGSLTVFRPLLP